LDKWKDIITACAPIAVALIGIIPTIIANRKKTQKSLEDFKHSVTKQNEETKKEVSELKTKFQEHADKEEEKDIIKARLKILEFSDDLYNSSANGIRFSKERFDQILEYVDDYEKYCDKHKGFKNSKAKSAINNIRDVYNKCVVNHSFLA